MNKQKLLEDLGRLGVPMMMPEEAVDASSVLADIVKSRDPRLWEGFPLVLANVLEGESMDWHKVKKLLSQSADQEVFKRLVGISRAVFQVYHVQFGNLDALLAHFKDSSRDSTQELTTVVDALARDAEIEVLDVRLSMGRVKSFFQRYWQSRGLKQQVQQVQYSEMAKEFALSQIFSPKQKELFYKRLYREKMTKTEREYYYRVVKKKVQALADPDLHRLAQRLMNA